MTWSDIPFAPPTRKLRQFAALWLAFFAGLAALEIQRHGMTLAALILAGLALAVGPVGWWRPRLVRPVFVGALVVTFPLGWIVSRLTLAVLYYSVFTPLGLALRLTRRDPLGLRQEPDRKSYWDPLPVTRNVRRYLRQF